MTKNRNLLLTGKKLTNQPNKKKNSILMAFVQFFKLDILVTDVVSFEYTSNMNSCIFQTAFHERGKKITW